MNAAMTKSLPAGLRAGLRHGPPWVASAITLCIGLAVAKLVWMVVPQPAWAPLAAQTDPAAAVQAARTNGVDLNGIINAAMFGKAPPPTAAPRVIDVEDAPDTRLNLTLKGIFAHDLSGQSRALIAAANGDEKSYAIGDEISRGTTIHEIYADRVILDRGGRLETLRLDKDKPARPLGRNARNSGGSSRTAAAGGRVVAPTQALRNIRQELLSDPSKASQYLRVQPAYNAGQLRGYRIYPGRNRSLFNEAGLRPGDLVTELNGTALNNAQNALQMLGDLSQATTLNVTVLRGGQTQNLSLTLN